MDSGSNFNNMIAMHRIHTKGTAAHNTTNYKEVVRVQRRYALVELN